MHLEVFTGITSGEFREKVITNVPVSDAFKRLIRLPSFGTLIDFGLSESVRLETGLIFAPRGSKTLNDKILLDYVDFPFTIIVQPKDFRVFFGPQISILANARTVDDFVLTDAFEKRDWGLRYGVGYEKKDFVVAERK